MDQDRRFLIRESADRVLSLGIEGLEAVRAGLSESFTETVERLLSIRGRLVLCGMGKSGHIARKVASTLSSTGSPALFLHSGEAGHGDLGMITKEDALIVFSNSGSGEEVSVLVKHTRRYELPLVGITREVGSELGVSADYRLILPAIEEGCWIGVAPTTSTMMMLALGDALAVALLRCKGFTVRDFSILHPRGELGKLLVQIKEIMHRGEALPLVGEDWLMSRVIVEMSAKGFGCCGVLGEGGDLIGMITDGDLRRHMSERFLLARAGEVMTCSPKVIEPEALALQALEEMNRSKISGLFVVEGGRAVGLVHFHDCLRLGLL